MDGQIDKTDDGGRLTPARIARGTIEAAVTLGIAALGVWQIARMPPPDLWAGFALIGLAFLAYVVRGKTLIGLTIGKDSIGATFAALEQKVNRVESQADQAARAASLAKSVATQYAAPPEKEQEPPGFAGATIAAAGRVSEAPDGWDHPGLVRGSAVRDDPQRNQWGNEAVRNGRLLSARVEQIDADWFSIAMRVAPTGNGAPLTDGTQVRFHLHDTFSRSQIVVRARNGAAELERVAWGAFTVGAEVEHEPGTYLELDLASSEVDAPALFRTR